MKNRSFKSVFPPVNSRSHGRKASSAIIGLLAALGAVSSANAALSSWSGATGGDWNTGSNWTATSVPTLSDDLTILGPGNSAGALTINIASATDILANTINFTDTSAVSLLNTSGSNRTLTLQAGLTTGSGAVTIGSSTANQNINIALGASQTWNIGSGGLTASNIISGTGFGITKTGVGTLVLSGVNTYTGGTTINAGTLQLTQTTGAAAAGTFNLGGGTLQINQGGNNFGYGAALNLTADSTFGNVGAGAINQTGAITGNSHALTVNNTGNRMYINGTVSGITQFNVTTGAMGFDLSGGNSGGGAAVNVSNGASLWVVNSTVTSTNNITLNGGTGYNSTGALFQENSNNTSTLSGTVTLNNGASSIGVGSATGTILLSGKVTGTGGITKIGSGTLTLSNSTNNYSGTTTVSAGTLAITGNSTGLTGGFVVNANGGNTASTLTLNGNTGSLASNASIKLNGGIFNYQNTTVGSTFDASGFTFSGGDRTYQSTYGTSGTAVLNLANATRTAGTVNNYTTSGGANGVTNKITFTSAPTTGVLVDKGDYFGGTSYLAYDTLGFARAYNYTTDANGATSIGGATLGSVTGMNVDLTTAPVTAQTTDSINTLRLGTTNGVAITTANTLSVDGILKSGGNAATISGGSIQAVSSGGEMVLRSNASGDTLTITSVIADNGTSSLTTSGLGTIALNAANTYAGGTNLGAGIVTFNNNTSFGTAAVTSNGGALIRNTAGVTTTNNWTINGATTLDVSSGNWNFNGNISGSGAITRGTNANLTLYLGGDNSGYTGTFTSPNNGNAVVRFASATAGSANASWVFNNTTVGRTTLSYGTGTTSFGSLSGGGQIQADVAGAKTISVGALGSNDIFSGIIANGTGTIALTKIGTGTMTLSGANTYTGATTISNGKLYVTGSLGNTATAVSGGTSTTLGGSGSVAGAVTVTNGSHLAPGTVTSSSNFGSAGTLTLSNASGLTLTSANLDFDLSTTAGGSNDKIALGSNALSFSTLNFAFSGTTLDTSTAYTLISTSGSLTSGTLANITSDFTNVSGGTYTASYNFQAGTGLQVTFTAVPESKVYGVALGMFCLVLLAARRRRTMLD